MTPVQIEVLMRVHYDPKAHENLQTTSYHRALDYLKSVDMIMYPGNGEVQLTEKGMCYVNYVKDLRLPVQTWVMVE